MIKCIARTLLLNLKHEIQRRYPASRFLFLIGQVAIESTMVYIGSTFLILYSAFSGVEFWLAGEEMLWVSVVYFVVRIVWLLRRKAPSAQSRR
jgi:hypothetical protein